MGGISGMVQTPSGVTPPGLQKRAEQVASPGVALASVFTAMGTAPENSFRALFNNFQSGDSVSVVRNLSAAINLIHTAQHGVDRSILLAEKIGALAEEAKGTGGDERRAINKEIGRLLGELDTLRSSSRYNGLSVFESRSLNFQAGAGAEDRIAFDLQAVTSFRDIARTFFNEGGYVASPGTGGPLPEGPAYTPSELDGWYEMLGADPASVFADAGGSVIQVDSRFGSLNQFTLNAIQNAAQSGSNTTVERALQILDGGFEGAGLPAGAASKELETLYEDSTLGRWMQKGGGGPGGDIVVLNPDSDQLAAGAAVDGANVAVLEKNGTAMMQTLDNVYQLGSEYEFTVALGDLVGTGEGGPGGPGGGGAPAAPAYTINLYAGDELIQSVTGTVTELDTLKDGITLTVEADRAALEGQPLSFEIVKTGGDALVVDNVRGVERRTNNVGEIVTTSLAIMDGSFEAPRLDDGEDDKLEDVYEDALPWMVDGGGPGGKDVKAIAYNGQTAVYLEKDDSAITQLLGEGYDANKTYEITLDLGDLAAGFGGGPGEGGAGVGGAAFRVSLLAGDEVIGTTSGNTGDRNGLEPVSFESVVIDPALEGAQLSLRIEKLGGEALVVDNIRGRVLQESASSAASDSASWTFEYEDASGALATKTVKATGANWTPDRLVDQVNATSGKTGWYAQRAEVNTTRAFIFMESATEDRTLTLETGQGSVEIEVSAGMTKAEFIDLVNAEGASIGIQAVEEKAVKPSDSLQELRFLSREDQVTVGFSLGASTLLFVPEGNTLEDNYSETFTKFVSFYRQDDLNLRVSQDSTVGDTTGFGEMQTLKLRDLSTNGGGPIETAPATTAEEALGALDDGRADFTIAAMARFADSLRSAQDYYGSLKDILKPAVDTANKVERAAEKAEGSERRELAATTFSQISRRIESTFEREKTRSESAQGNVNGQFVLKLLKQAGLSLGVSAGYLTNLQNALAA